MISGFRGIIQTLSDAGVDYILVGGLAAIVHGASRATYDVDVVFQRSRENLVRLVNALSACSPYPRDAPPGLPFRWDLQTLRSGTNFTLTTSLGHLDLLGEITGGGSYEDLLPFSRTTCLFDRDVQVLDLPELIRVKKAAGRPKDYEAISELELLLQRREM